MQEYLSLKKSTSQPMPWNSDKSMSYETYQNVIRPQQGLAISLTPDKNGQTQIVLDAVHRPDQLDGPVAWEHVHMCTMVEYETKLLIELLQNREEMARLGKSILRELLSQCGRSYRLPE
jgi:hypothetical protein